MATNFYPSVTRVSEIRKENNCSLSEAQRIARKELLLMELERAGTLEQLKKIVEDLIERQM